jgi:N-acetyl-gamma-glutamylphosphate reductase
MSAIDNLIKSQVRASDSVLNLLMGWDDTLGLPQN